MTCREQYFSICNFVSPESTTLLRMKCQCLVSRHWLGSISVYDKQHANFMNLLEGFLLCSLEIEMQRTPHQTMLVASVMLTCNLWQDVGMCNGVIGVVEDVLFHHDRLPPCLPIAALVEFANYTVPVF